MKHTKLAALQQQQQHVYSSWYTITSNYHGLIFVIHNNKEIINIDLKNGKIRWVVEIKNFFQEENNNLWLSPVLINSKLIVVGGNKNLIIINPYNGELEKKYNLPGNPITSPIIVKKEIFIFILLIK